MQPYFYEAMNEVYSPFLFFLLVKFAVTVNAWGNPMLIFLFPLR